MWQVKFHHLVISEDFKNIPPVYQERILKIIDRKLSLDPQAYGKPLRGNLSGYWRLRVEDYRVVYRIVKDKIVVLVIKVGIRKDDKVYEELLLRLRKI